MSMKLKILIYAATFICVKYATFAKDWDTATVIITAFATMIVGIMLFELGRSLLQQGKQGIVFTALMITGAIVFYFDEFHHISWYLDFQNDTVNTLVSLVSVVFVGKYLLMIWRMFITREEE